MRRTVTALALLAFLAAAGAAQAQGERGDPVQQVLEVEHLIRALTVAGKTGFEYKIYQDAPGGHSFSRLDTKPARESRREIWVFLARHLRPARPPQ